MKLIKALLQKIKMQRLLRATLFSYSLILLFSSIGGFAANGAVDPTQMLSVDQYNRMEPYLNNRMRNTLKPADAKYNMSSNQAMARAATPASGAALSGFANINAGTRKYNNAQNARAAVNAPNAGARRVVKRPVVARAATAAKQTAARAAAPQPASTKARAAAINAPARGGATPASARRVVQRARAAAPGANAARAAATAATASSQLSNQAIRKAAGERTASQCLADYTSCMENYCHRPNMRYDRCYCSAKLSQLDAQYKPEIDRLTNQLAILKNGVGLDEALSQEEANQSWDEIFGATGGNSMA
ncbi:MAG: hypothetical protein LBL46_02075, partial [Rickettsiales bacterium]|nr:hypothetical protein [Rickettsiales bacterium]